MGILKLVLPVFAAALFLSSPSHAFNEADLRKLLTTKECAGCDLIGADLTVADLRGANLTDAKLAGANLTNANLTGSTLYFADFTGASVTGARFTGARLTNAIWIDGRLCAHRSTGSCNNE